MHSAECEVVAEVNGPSGQLVINTQPSSLHFATTKVETKNTEATEEIKLLEEECLESKKRTTEEKKHQDPKRVQGNFPPYRTKATNSRKKGNDNYLCCYEEEDKELTKYCRNLCNFITSCFESLVKGLSNCHTYLTECKCCSVCPDTCLDECECSGCKCECSDLSFD